MNRIYNKRRLGRKYSVPSDRTKEVVLKIAEASVDRIKEFPVFENFHFGFIINKSSKKNLQLISTLFEKENQMLMKNKKTLLLKNDVVVKSRKY